MSGKKMQGVRQDPSDERPFVEGPGHYGRASNGEWVCCTPNGYHGRLKNHDVVEHEDGTITVSPSIRVMGGLDCETELWHGWLERGVWRSC